MAVVKLVPLENGGWHYVSGSYLRSEMYVSREACIQGALDHGHKLWNEGSKSIQVKVRAIFQEDEGRDALVGSVDTVEDARMLIEARMILDPRLTKYDFKVYELTELHI